MDDPRHGWLERVGRASGPIYLRILQALEGALRSGELQPGDQLPPQRAVATRLGVDFTTVTRAYAAARDRGLVEGTVGRGTFVRRRAAQDDAQAVDLSMNLPPPPANNALGRALRDTADAILARADPATLMAYHPPSGSPAQRAAGSSWLAPTLGAVAPGQVVMAAGAQAALAAILTTLLRPGEAFVVEPHTYPGVLGLARQLRLTPLPCPVDDEGFDPDALDAVCGGAGVNAIYVVPTFQNPVATTMGPERRAAVAKVARRREVAIVEDDAYGRLPARPTAALATHAPELTWHVATLAKALSPGLRTAVVAAPSVAAAERLADALRTVSLMPAPLMTAIAVRWIQDGVAEDLLGAVRAEALARRGLARALLPAARGADEAIHLWLELPAGWDGHTLSEAAGRRGLAAAPAEAFAVGAPANAVRLSLGAAETRTALAAGLKALGEILAGEPPRPFSDVV